MTSKLERSENLPERSENSLPELLPCPFCQQKTDIKLGKKEVWGDYMYFAFCFMCCTCGPQMTSQEKAITAWNTRHHSAERDRAIARAGFEAGGREAYKQKVDYTYLSADDYLQSDEFLSLIGGKK
jgi:hypothetical protein